MSQLWEINAVVEADSINGAMHFLACELKENAQLGDALARIDAVKSLDVRNGVESYNPGARYVEMSLHG